MVIHYGATPEGTACGRNGLSLNSTQDQAQVSCKRCQQAVAKLAAAPLRKTPSLADLRAAAKAAKAAAQPAAVNEAPLAALTAASATPSPAVAVTAATPKPTVAPAPNSVPSESQAQPVQAAASSVVSDHAAAPTPRKSARAEWLARLQQMPGQSRLPRGAAKKSKR